MFIVIQKVIFIKKQIKIQTVVFLKMDFTSSVDDISFYEEPPNLQEELDAILRLDFEQAVELAKKRYKFNDDEALNEQLHYEEQAQILSQQNFDDYNEEINNIKKDFYNTAQKIKLLWQDRCKKLVAKHRQEAEQFEKKWKKTRKLVKNRINICSETSLATAKLLAMCEQYDQAIDIRNSAQNNQSQSENIAEVKKIDKEFTIRYKNMIKRHFSEYILLHKNLRTLLKTLKDRAEAMKKSAEFNLQVEEARNTTLIIQTISKEGFNSSVKEKVIQSFSPRYSRRGNLNRSALSNSSHETLPSNFSMSTDANSMNRSNLK